MASDLVDGDYLGSYRRFIVDFLERVNPDDQLPIKTAGHDVSEGEMVGEIIHMTLQYLNQQLCPPSLQCYIVQLVIEEIKATCRKQPESCGYRQEEKTYAPLQLMQAVVSKVNEICQRYLENSRLALLPPPPSTPMPLANAFAIRNIRRKMEDRHVILHDLNTIFNIKDDSIASYYAVFDGHAGYQAAVFCAAHLHQYLAESLHYPTNPERALREAFLTADEIFVQKSTSQAFSSGTTAVCALILNRKLYVAWVGDSQAALAKRGVVTQLVNSHKPDRNDERERVEQMGGTVMHLGIWRVNGILAVSRAIGDAQYKPYVTGDPEIRCITLDGDEDFLIIGCDGLWDCVTENEAAALVYRDLCRDPYDYDSASQRLVEYAKSQGSEDNITVIVVFLVAPSKIASRYPHNGNPLHADVQLNNMEPDNRYLSNANGQFDVNSAFAKQTATNNGSPDLMDDEDPYGSYGNKSSNVKHRENGSSAVESADYDAEEDDEDLGPETDVDALDDVSEPMPTLADVSRQLFPEKQDPCELYESEERMDDEVPPSPQATKTNQQALIPEADNVGDSEDSEDEWNYYRIDPNKEKEPAGAAGFSPEPKADNETLGDIAGASSPIGKHDFHGDEKNDEEHDEKHGDRNESDSSSEPDSEREIGRENALIDNVISAETNFEPITPAATVEKSEKEESEKFVPEKESEEFIPEEEQQQQHQQDANSEHEEDMDFQLNPNAAEFVPVSPTPIIPNRMDLDAPIAGSPLKQTPVMDDIAIPSRREFENEVRNRPCEIEEKSSCTNGQLLADLDDCGAQKSASTANFNLDESEVSSTKAEFGDDTSFLTASEFQRTGISNLDGSFNDSYGVYDDSTVDPMTKSYGPGDFMVLGNPVDLNAVHDLPADDDPLSDENVPREIVEDEEKMNLENIQASVGNIESADSRYNEETSVDPFFVEKKANFLDSSSRASSPSSSINEKHPSDEIVEDKFENSVSAALEALKFTDDAVKSLDDAADASFGSQPIYDDNSVTSKLLEMDLEDRGSQDCGFQKCSELNFTSDNAKHEAEEIASPEIVDREFVAQEEKFTSEEDEKLAIDEKFTTENAKIASDDANLVAPDNFAADDKFVAPDNFAADDKFVTRDNFAAEDKFATQDDFATLDNFAAEEKFATQDNFAALDNFAAEEKFATQDNFAAENKFATQDNFATLDNFAAEEKFATQNDFATEDKFAAHDNFATEDRPATQYNFSTQDNYPTDDAKFTAQDNFATDDAKFTAQDNFATDDAKFTSQNNFATDDAKFTAQDNFATDDAKFTSQDNIATEENIAGEDKFVTDNKFTAENEKLSTDDQFVTENLQQTIDNDKFVAEAEKLIYEDENIPRNDNLVDFQSSALSRDDLAASPVPESLPIASPQLEPQLEKLAESLDDLQTAVNDYSSAHNVAPPEVPILLNPLDLHIETTQTPQDDVPVEDTPDYLIAKAPESPVDLISPLVQNEQKNNPFETADFGSPMSFGDPQDAKLPQDVKLHELDVEPKVQEPEITESQPKVEEHREIPAEIVEVTSGLKLSESLQEFTGLEEQLNPDSSTRVSNGLESENLLDIPSEETKIVATAAETEIAKPAELTEEATKVESPKEPVVEEKKIEITTAEPVLEPTETAKIAKEETLEATVAATVATAAAASAVAVAAVAATTKATKAKPPVSKTAGKSGTSTKPPSNKSTPTSPTKPAITARTSSLAAAKKAGATTTATRPTKLDTGKPTSTASKTSAVAKSTTASVPKTTGRLSVSSPRTKPATSTVSKSSASSGVEKKPTSNGDATKSSLLSSKASPAAKSSSAKPLVKSSTTRATSATTTTSTVAARARTTTAAAATSSVTKTLSKTTTGTVGTTTQRPKTAPTGGATTLAATKSRVSSSTKSPITEKQIKETANKQISSSRTSTTTTASKTSRTSVSSSTTTTTRRAATSKTTSATSSAATTAVPPPIRKPAPITRPTGKNLTSNPPNATATVTAAAAAPTTNGKTHATKTTATNKTKVVVQNGVCTAEQETKIVTSTTSNLDEDVPKKDLSPVEPQNDNQLIVAAD